MIFTLARPVALLRIRPGGAMRPGGPGRACGTAGATSCAGGAMMSERAVSSIVSINAHRGKMVNVAFTIVPYRDEENGRCLSGIELLEGAPYQRSGALP